MPKFLDRTVLVTAALLLFTGVVGGSFASEAQHPGASDAGRPAAVTTVAAEYQLAVTTSGEHNLDDDLASATQHAGTSDGGRPAAVTTVAAKYYTVVTTSGEHNLDDVESC